MYLLGFNRRSTKDKNVVLLSGDIGNRMFDKFKNSVSKTGSLIVESLNLI